MIDARAVADGLILLTGELVPHPGVDEAQLDWTRELLAEALAKDQAEPLSRHVQPGAIGSPHTVDVLEALAAAAVAEAADPNAPPLRHRIFRRTWRTWPHLEDDPAAAWTGGRGVNETLGPFDDESGDRVYFDVYRLQPFVELFTPDLPESSALLGALVPSDDATVFLLGDGTVWLRAGHLAGGSPDGWCGLQVSSGELRLDNPPVFHDAELRLHGGGGHLVMTLAPPPAAGGGAGVAADATTSSVDLPPDLQIRLDSIGLTVTALGDASLEAYGSTVQLGWEGEGARFEPALDSVIVPMLPTTNDFAFATSASTLFTPGGGGPVAWAGWALPVTPPSQLMGDAEGAGQVVVAVADGSTASRAYVSGTSSPLGEVTVVAEPGRLGVLAPAAAPREARGVHQLWPAHPQSRRRGGRFEVRRTEPFELRYLSVSDRSELMLAETSVIAHIDRPVRSDGRRFALRSAGARIVVHRDRVGDLLDLDGALPILETGPDGVDRPIPRPSLALANALLSTSTPRRIRVVGRLDSAGHITMGSLGLDFLVYSLLPTLPDPYAGNLDLSPLDEPVQSVRASIAATVRWRGGGEEHPVPQIHRIAGRLEDALLPSLPPEPAETPDHDALLVDAERERDLADMFHRAVDGVEARSLLLDLSSAIDRFGVGIGIPPTRLRTVDRLSFEHGRLAAPLSMLRAFTLPPVQWEPVVTEPDPALPFPSPVAFPNDGGATVLGTNAVRLVQVVPEAVLGAIMAASTAERPTRTAMLTTLPFGMRAVAFPHLAPDPGLPGGELAENRPTFDQEALLGGMQVSVVAVPPAGPPSSESPSLPGATIQLRSLIDPQTGTPHGLSVLGDMGASVTENIFNSEFGPAGSNERVPISRLDLSGYGASMFSDWRNPDAEIAQTTQVRFDVIVGRTSHEVVQVKSLLYPYAVWVVRTIVIQRTSAGQVIRHDSGWQAASDGLWRFPGVPAIVVNPGLVQGAFQVRRIRDTPHVFETADKTARLAAVRFDADLEIEGAVLGQGDDGRVPARDQLGFVQLPPTVAAGAVQPLTPGQFAELLAMEGPLGGRIDAVVDIGGSGQRMRVMDVHTATAPVEGIPDPEFAAAVRGSLVLPAAGQWTATVRPTDGGEPTPLDPHRGMPLVRRGAPGLSPGTNPHPYRLAEPKDLLAAVASVEYGLLAGTDSQRVLFPSPKIEPGSRAITSTSRPLVADMYALSSSVGFFPKTAQVIEVPTTDHELQVEEGGRLQLQLPFPNFSVNRPARELLKTPSVRTYVEYADESGTPSEVELMFDSEAPEPLEINIARVSIVNDISPFDGIVRLRGRIRSSSRSGTSLEEPKVVFGSVLGPVQEIITVLQDIGFPAPFLVSMTNSDKGPHRKYKLKVSLELPLALPKAPFFGPEAPPGKNQGYIETGIGRIKGELAIGIEIETEYDLTGVVGPSEAPRIPPGTLAPQDTERGEDLFGPPSPATYHGPSVTFFAEAKADLLTVIIPQLLYAGGHFALEIETQAAGTLPTQIKLVAGATGMIGGELLHGFLELSATVRRGYLLVITDEGVRPGLMVGIEGEAEILQGGLIGIAFSAEAQGVIERADEHSITLLAELKFAADITLAHFLKSSIEVETEYREKLPTVAVAALAVAIGYPTYP